MQQKILHNIKFTYHFSLPWDLLYNDRHALIIATIGNVEAIAAMACHDNLL